MESTEDDRQKIFQHSLKKAVSLTVIVCILYVCQIIIGKRERGLNSFMILFICLLCIFYTLNINIPEFNSNIQSGIGWGLGGALLRQILPI